LTVINTLTAGQLDYPPRLGWRWPVFCGIHPGDWHRVRAGEYSHFRPGRSILGCAGDRSPGRRPPFIPSVGQASRGSGRGL